MAEGTLDYFGRPKVVLRKQNVHFSLHAVNLSITYRYDQTYMLIKPLMFAIVIFCAYLMAIIFSRAQVSFSDYIPPILQKTVKQD